MIYKQMIHKQDRFGFKPDSALKGNRGTVQQCYSDASLKFHSWGKACGNIVLENIPSETENKLGDWEQGETDRERGKGRDGEEKRETDRDRRFKPIELCEPLPFPQMSAVYKYILVESSSFMPVWTCMISGKYRENDPLIGMWQYISLHTQTKTSGMQAVYVKTSENTWQCEY